RPGRVDREHFFAVNERFHMRLLAVADNRWRDQLVADLRKVMKLNRHNSLLKTGRIAESLAEHRALMAAIEARDPQAAVARMQAHFRSWLEPAAWARCAAACDTRGLDSAAPPPGRPQDTVKSMPFSLADIEAQIRRLSDEREAMEQQRERLR